MNILLIGNGFDLAHGLPTKYTDFLDFVSSMKKLIIDYKKTNDNNLHRKDHFNNLSFYIKSRIYRNFEYAKLDNDYKNHIDLWDEIISNNIWIEYFLKNRKNIKTNWIDFEKEILFVIDRLDQFINDNLDIINSVFFEENVKYDDSTRNLKILLDTYKNKFWKLTDTTKFNIYSFITELEKDLEKLIFTLELYISNFINKITVTVYSKEIKQLQIDWLISFNYSNTFERVYINLNTINHIECDYVHGKAISHSKYEDNELVLGINEYLSDEEKNKNIRFIRFKKFFQRIHKNTGCLYKNWIDKINNSDNKQTHNLYIFGHSLDDTDRDILRELILNEHIVTTIYYHNKEAYAQQIANLVKVIGQDELISKTGGVSKTIIFKELLPM